MSDPNTTPPPFRGGPGEGAGTPPGGPPPAAPPSFMPPTPGQFPHHPSAPLQPPAQAYAPWNPADGWIPELGVKITSAGVRIGAKAIDIALYLAIQIVVGLVAALIWISTGGADDESFATGPDMFAVGGPSVLFSIAAGLALIAVDLLYNVVCTARFGGTPGKLLLGARVIYQDGRRIDLRGSFVRFSPILALSVIGMVPILNIVSTFARLGLLIANLVLVLTDERRRDVFDRVASTYVISSR